MNNRLYLGLVLVWTALLGYAQEKVPCRVALVQAKICWGEVEANLSAFDKRLEQCKGCDVVIFPELFVSGCEMKKKDPRVARLSKDGVAECYPTVMSRMKKWASTYQIMVVGSTIYKEEGKYYNRLLAVAPDGAVVHYDKHNCFKKGSFSSGDRQLVFHWRGRRFATYICYDLRFPEWSRNDGRYDVAIYVANWPESRRNDWVALLRERAIENQAQVIGVNCVGTAPDGVSYTGDSQVLNAKGEVAGQCKAGEEAILIYDL